MLMDYLNEEKRLAKLADKVAKKREQSPNNKRLAKKAEKVAVLQEKQAVRLTEATELRKKQEERVARQAERVAEADAIIAASKARTAQNNAEIKAVWNETVGMMRDINHQHAQQRSDMLNNSLNRSRRNDSE